MDKTLYTALGLMSGTSLDGVDATFLVTDGYKIERFGPSLNLPYSGAEREQLLDATEAALRWRFDGVPPNNLMAAEHVVHLSHVRAVETLCAEFPDWAAQLDMIGFHGQTVLHQPPSAKSNGRTLQLGVGQTLADTFNIPCAYDFRSADMEAGGQGAPLAPIYHKALCDYSGLEGNTVILNLGGVGNFTWVGEGPLLASDTGPANGPLDSWLNQYDHDFDPDGKYAASGQIDFARIEAWLATKFFKQSIPKSADRYDFDVLNDIAGMSLEDGAATLAAFCALSVKRTLNHLPTLPDQIIICGGGRKNQTIMNMVRAEMTCPVKAAEDVGWQGDFIEAQAFAYRAVRSQLGLPISFPETTGVPKLMTGGRIAYPASSSLGSRGGQ